MKKPVVKIAENFYLKNYQWVLVTFVFIILYYLCSGHLSSVKDPLLYLQTIFIGMITFSIPFLWNAYQVILEIKKKLAGEGIANIIAREYYSKASKYFEAFLLYPTAAVVFLGIVVVPLMPLWLVGISVAMAAIFFTLQTRIFQWIESSAATDLKSFIDAKASDNADLVQAFNQLWQNDDAFNEKEFSLAPIALLGSFVTKINDLLK